MRLINKKVLNEARNYDKSMEEAFVAGSAGEVIPKILAVLGRRLATEFTLSPIPVSYVNHLGKFTGYFAGFRRDQMIRINFELGRSDTIISVDYWKQPSSHPTYTINLRGFNIIQVLDAIADVITGEYFEYTREEASIPADIKESRQGGKGHPTLVLTWLRDNPEVVATLRQRGKANFDVIRNDYSRYARQQGLNPNISLSSLRVYISGALKILKEDPAAANVPTVQVNRGTPEHTTAMTPEVEALYNELVLENPAISKMRLYQNHLLQIKNKNPDYRGVYVYGQGGIGKAQPLYAKILTPNGWITMEEIKIGDEVIDPNGNIVNVTAIFPQGEKDIYEIIFADGSKARSCKEHLWECWYDGSLNTRMPRELGEIEEMGLKTSDDSWKWAIPLLEKPLNFYEFETKELLVDPYLLGALIGNGGLTTITPGFTSADQFIIDKLSDILLKENMKIEKRESSKYSYGLKKNKKDNKPSSLSLKLRDLGLMGKKSSEKEIPEMYLWASIESRIALLCGLMDTDGYISKTGITQFNTISKKLAEQVRYLIKSLGGWASL